MENKFKNGDLVIIYRDHDDKYYSQVFGFLGIIKYKNNEYYMVNVINNPVPNAIHWIIPEDIIRYPTEEELILYGS